MPESVVSGSLAGAGREYWRFEEGVQLQESGGQEQVAADGSSGRPGRGGRGVPPGQWKRGWKARWGEANLAWAGWLPFLGFLPSAQTQRTHLVLRDGKPPLNLTAP